MMSNGGNVETRPVWFVGSSFGSNDDQTERFLRGGIWEGGSEKPSHRSPIRGTDQVDQPGRSNCDEISLRAEERVALR